MEGPIALFGLREDFFFFTIVSKHDHMYESRLLQERLVGTRVGNKNGPNGFGSGPKFHRERAESEPAF